MRVKDNILFIAVIILSASVVFLYLNEEDPIEIDPRIEIQKDSAIAASKRFKAQSDSLKELYEKLNDDHERLLIDNKSKQKAHEKHIRDNIINANDSDLILETFKLADSILQAGYDSTDIY